MSFKRKQTVHTALNIGITSLIEKALHDAFEYDRNGTGNVSIIDEIKAFKNPTYLFVKAQNWGKASNIKYRFDQFNIFKYVKRNFCNKRLMHDQQYEYTLRIKEEYLEHFPKINLH